MKHLQKFEKFSYNNCESTNESLTGMAALGALMFGSAAILHNFPFTRLYLPFYGPIKKLSSKLKGLKYTPTGKSEIIKTQVPHDELDKFYTSSPKNIELEFEIKEFRGNDGKIYWGYDHLYTPYNTEDFRKEIDRIGILGKGGILSNVFKEIPLSLYTSYFKEEDLGDLKSFFKAIKSEKTNTLRSGGGFGGRPEAVDISFKRNLSKSELNKALTYLWED